MSAVRMRRTVTIPRFMFPSFPAARLPTPGGGGAGTEGGRRTRPPPHDTKVGPSSATYQDIFVWYNHVFSERRYAPNGEHRLNPRIS
jgi:hypothetical protein